jgi:hypothetical protein
MYDIYERLATYGRYKKFMFDVKQFVSPYHHEMHPIKRVQKYCDNAGLTIKHIEMRERVYVYGNSDQVKGKICNYL